MAINKVVFGEETLMDITDSTVEPGNVVVGNVFYDRSGARSVGTLGPATPESDGLMSANDKGKLDGISIECKTTAEWRQMVNYIPPAGAIMIYSDGGIKIGDGTTYGIDLPFVTDEVVASLNSHISDPVVHTTAAEKQFWNNKINYGLEGELLILNRN